MVRLELVAVLAALSSTYAFKWIDAKPTAADPALPSAISRFNPPKPTQAPDAPYDLLRRGPVRRTSAPITAYSAPDATCGFFDGRAGAPLSCGTEDTCFMAQTAPGSGLIGCCPIGGSVDQCGFRSNCINAYEFANGTLCDSGCLHDTYTLKCTASSAPFCNALTWPENGVHDFFCDDTFIETTQTLFTTYSGETDRTWLTNIYSDSSLTTSFDSTTTTSSTTTSSSTSSSITPTPTPGPKHKTPVGPIVGGVVGGLAAIAGIAAAVIFFLRHNRNKRNKEASAAAAAAAGGAGAGGAPPGGPPAYMHPDSAAKPPLDPNHQSYYAPANQTGYVPPGAQYAPQQSPEMQQAVYPQQPQQGGYYDPNNPAGYYNPSSPASQLHPNATSPTNTTAFSTAGTLDGAGGGSATGSTGAYGYSSPRPGFSEMSANMAGGPFPSDQHEGTFEVEGSAPPVTRPPGVVNEMDGRQGGR